MKKFLFILSAGIIVLLGSCNSKKEAGGMSETAKKNLEANHAIIKMFEAGDWSKIGDYIATDAVDHVSMTGKDVVGLDSIKAQFDKMGQMMGDMKNEVVKELADDEYVMSWMKETSTSKVDDPAMGMKKGKTDTYNAIEVSRYKDGKVVEHWSFISMNDMMKMMSEMGGQNSMPMPGDTTKMGNK